MTVEYREGAWGPTERYALGVLFVILVVTTLYLFAVGPVRDVVEGRGLTRLDAIGIPTLMLAIVATALGIRLAAPGSIPIRIESGTIYFPKRGTWALMLGRTSAIPSTHVAGVDVMWANFPVRGGGRKWFMQRVVLRTLDGGSHAKLYHEYRRKEQEWGQETSEHLGRLFGSKVRHMIARTGQPVPSSTEAYQPGPTVRSGWQ